MWSLVASYLHRRPSTRQVRLFSIAGEYAKALDLCVMHSIHLSEEVAEKMCPERSEILSEQDESQKNLLLKVAKVLKRQGNYHLASKKYTQAGDKVKAMKCLLKSGDTDKICYFAGVSRVFADWPDWASPIPHALAGHCELCHLLYHPCVPSLGLPYR